MVGDAAIIHTSCSNFPEAILHRLPYSHLLYPLDPNFSCRKLRLKKEVSDTLQTQSPEQTCTQKPLVFVFQNPLSFSSSWNQQVLLPLKGLNTVIHSRVTTLSRFAQDFSGFSTKSWKSLSSKETAVDSHPTNPSEEECHHCRHRASAL